MPEQPSKELLTDTGLVVGDALSPHRSSAIVVAGVAAFALLLAGSIALWMHYGTAVFFEIIRSGFIACFG